MPAEQKVAQCLLVRYTVLLESGFWIAACRMVVSDEGIEQARAGETTPRELQDNMTAGTDSNMDTNGGQPSTDDVTTTTAETETPVTTAAVATEAAPDPTQAFAALGLGDDALRAIRELGFGEP